MRRASKGSSPKLSGDSQRLVTFAQAIMLASSRVEERAWERSLDTLLQKMLKNDQQEAIDAALEQLFKADPGAYDALMESAEAVSESCTLEQDGIRYDALLIAAPILAWTRFAIASGPIAADMLSTLTAHLHAHLLAPDVRMALAPTLFSIDQLPHTQAETAAVTHRMAQAALTSSALRAPVDPPETAPFLADTRYLLAVVTVPTGGPIFRWQSTPNLAEREQALSQWRAQATPNIARLLPGCGVELLLPEAYYLACREADKKIRPASIHAAVHYLTHALNIEPAQLQVSIGSFSEDAAEDRIDEYRIGFASHDSTEVVYGVVWPLYGPEEAELALFGNSTAALLAAPPGANGEPEAKPALEEIVELLKTAGVAKIKRHGERFPMEFCDDCGSPLYCDWEGELTHAEMPEDAPQGTTHLH